jgi:hypothetical protein
MKMRKAEKNACLALEDEAKHDLDALDATVGLEAFELGERVGEDVRVGKRSLEVVVALEQRISRRILSPSNTTAAQLLRHARTGATATEARKYLQADLLRQNAKDLLSAGGRVHIERLLLVIWKIESAHNRLPLPHRLHSSANRDTHQSVSFGTKATQRKRKMCVGVCVCVVPAVRRCLVA